MSEKSNFRFASHSIKKVSLFMFTVKNTYDFPIVLRERTISSFWTAPPQSAIHSKRDPASKKPLATSSGLRGERKGKRKRIKN